MASTASKLDTKLLKFERSRISREKNPNCDGILDPTYQIWDGDWGDGAISRPASEEIKLFT